MNPNTDHSPVLTTFLGGIPPVDRPTVTATLLVAADLWTTHPEMMQAWWQEERRLAFGSVNGAALRFLLKQRTAYFVEVWQAYHQAVQDGE